MSDAEFYISLKYALLRYFMRLYRNEGEAVLVWTCNTESPDKVTVAPLKPKG